MSASVTPWVSKTNPVKDGEQVNAQTTNRQPGQLQQRTDYLKQRLDNITAGRALYATNVAVSTDVETGFAVYWNAVKQEYQPALAKVEFNGMLGAYTIADSSYAVGMCVFKYSTTRADIVLFGLAVDFDLTNCAGVSGFNPAEAGAYYLSSAVAGHIVRQKPPVSVFICFARGDGSVHVQPTPRDLLDSHIHYAFDLVAQPAGQIECPHVDMPYVFAVPNPMEQGWLPVSEFDPDTVPVGAKYGYNLVAHPELDRVWPPIPTDSVYIEQNGIGVPHDRFIVNIHGLWWMEDCYGKAPWATEPRPCGGENGSSSLSSSSTPSSSSSSGAPETCKPTTVLEQQGFYRRDPLACSLRIYFTKMIFKTAGAVVTSLRAKTGSPILVTNCDGTPATTGDLQLDIDLGLSAAEGDDGGEALKSVTGTKFTRGRVIAAVKAGPNVQISGGTVAEDEYVSGKVTISAVPDTNVGGGADLVAFNGSREERTDEIFYLSFPQNHTTSMRLRVALPLSGVPEGAKLQMWFWLMAGATGTVLPKLHASYRIVPRPPEGDEASLPTTDTALPDIDPTAFGAIDNLQYVETLSEKIAVSNGNTLFFTLQRTDDGVGADNYPGDVGVLRIGYSLTT